MKRYLLLIVAVFVLSSSYYLLKRYYKLTQPNNLSEYAPADCLAYIELNRISDLIGAITETSAWQELAPQFGIPRELQSIDELASFLAVTGLGEDKLPGLLTAEFAAVIDGLSIEGSPANSEVEIVPALTVLIKTNAKPEAVSELVKSKSQLLAKRIYGKQLSQNSFSIANREVYRYAPVNASNKQLLAAAYGNLILISNNDSSIERCITAIAQGNTLAKNQQFAKLRKKASIFAYITPNGIGKFLSLATSVPNGQRINESAVLGLTYELNFDTLGAEERFELLLHPELTSKLSSFQQATLTDSRMLRVGNKYEVWLLNSAQPIAYLHKLVEVASISLPAAAAFTLNNFVIELEQRFGIDDSTSQLLGNEIGIVRLAPDRTVKFAKVKDKLFVLNVSRAYLQSDDTKAVIRSEQIAGNEVVIGNQSRAATFLDEYLLVGHKEDLAQVIEAYKEPSKLQTAKGSITVVEPCDKALADFFLRLSHLLRTTDGSKDHLLKVKSNLRQRATGGSLTENGLVIESRSPLGPIPLLAELILPLDEEVETWQSRQKS
ncbi:MAG: hypothetical protein RMM17_05795 [Acidobacteriota bacterium]|nr:hypothetical protein [Blastocatellia bacterium]MDW8412179.1 hypothetical protein [Acidobacteriota bacterium]